MLTSTSLKELGLFSSSGAIQIGQRSLEGMGGIRPAISPIDGSDLATLRLAAADQVPDVISEAQKAFRIWRRVPAPKRGELVRRIGEKLREKKALLAEVVSWEVGKITQESLGEVQEMIDICDYAVGLSRQLFGLTIASERPHHRLMEQWHPLGPTLVITAFNFPVAVWAWNTMIALVCGNPIIWKPSEKAPLCALATHALVQEVLKEFPDVPDGLLSVMIGDSTLGQRLTQAPEIPLVSATGSVRMGKAVAQTVAQRLGRSLLELGGNNGMIVAPSAELDLAVRSIVFAAVGTCGQRCTTLRRLIVHRSIRENLLDRLKRIYNRLPIGNPRQAGILVGPLIDAAAFQAMQRALERAVQDGGIVTGGTRLTSGVPLGGYYVHPALVEMPAQTAIVREETFAPILYVLTYDDLEEAIALHNAVPQGLSSAILTNNLREAEYFLSPMGSDCGIANVNIGTSGAEIGGAFGGEKETGGGRESGSDSWKAYMRRVTNTINYSLELPLAQGIRFDID
ncbi:MAG: aldehyde dehydrogenase family protein [Gemmataceae bacterium]|nr:aldehyde dehydrogenase family protein [Gemmataceae bacterium]